MGGIVYFRRPVQLHLEFDDMAVHATATPTGETDIEITGRIRNVGSETIDIAYQIVDFKTQYLAEKAGKRLIADHYLPMSVTKYAEQNAQLLASGESLAFRHTLSIPHSQLKNAVAHIGISGSTCDSVLSFQRRGYTESPPCTIDEP
ncbi:hypothetical protein Rcae01_00665 [Novipirellula caenicola]|uniref:Arrestin-like N-terminal domain-containing protein n=2 Tax=Novipirellula caenicola TaxID=1536901 RepID=A0ABP9VP71_9BACT